MQKKLIAAAIGAALASAAFAAQAEVTVYGRAQFEWAQVTNDLALGSFAFGSSTSGSAVGSWNNGGTVPAGYTRSATLDNKMGRFGIKADEDLGGGWKGIAQFEWQVDTADGADGTPISERISVVGVSQKQIGSLTFGQDHSPYKLSGVALDPFVATALEARNNYGMSGNRDNWGVMNAHNGFVQDGLFFKSASWAGVYVNAYLGLDQTGANSTCQAAQTLVYWNNCDAPATNNNKTNGDISAVVGWKWNGPVGLHIFGGYAKMANTGAPPAGSISQKDPEAIKIGAQVTFLKAHTVSCQFEQVDRGGDAVAPGYFSDYNKGDYLFCGYQGKFGPVTAVAQLGSFQSGTEAQPGSARDVSADYYAIGAIFQPSKTFRVYGGYRNTTADLNGTTLTLRDDSVISIGIRKDF